MLGLPKSTEYNKIIPKKKFYDNLTISADLKRCFADQIKKIIWTNKIAVSTINLAPGNNVTEIEVFNIKLNESSLDEAVLKQIDREIPYHILFVLEYEEKYQLWIGYKESSAGKLAFKVSKYYHTDWLNEGEVELTLDGLSIDDVYENFVRNIAGDVLSDNKEESLEDAVAREEEIALLNKRIEKLKTKVRREKQFNRQMEYNKELKQLKKELEELTNG